MMSDSVQTTFLVNNKRYLESLMGDRRYRRLIKLHPVLRRILASYERSCDDVEKNAALVNLFNSLEGTLYWRFDKWNCAVIEDRDLKRKYGNQRTRIDYSDPSVKDYYSVAVILKNEARYLREYILFYKATGADRLYLYDNDSTDNIMEVIDPFVKEGFVVYQKWPGKIVQQAAYRNVIRKTRSRTKWLAIVDSDEFLFSPLGNMKEQLKAYEAYPGIGVNWRVYGPNGHDKRPPGLIMDNYTTTIADSDETVNRHIKSIVQPKKVFTTFHTHYVIYKRHKYAVDETKNNIDNTNAFYANAGKAFTAHNHGDVFRINHYFTKSLEDLRVKCARGYADGAPNRNFEEALAYIDHPLAEDKTILVYADIVRGMYEQYKKD